MYQRKGGGEQQPWQPEPAGPRLASRRHVSTWEGGGGGAGRKGWVGNARSRPLHPPATPPRWCNSWECDGFTLASFLHPYPLPPAPGCPLHAHWCFIGELMFSFGMSPFLEIGAGSPVIRQPLSSSFLLMPLYLHRNGPPLKALQTPRQAITPGAIILES